MKVTSFPHLPKYGVAVFVAGTGITTYLQNGGTLEHAQTIATRIAAKHQTI
jgi:hypothetical protein